MNMDKMCGDQFDKGLANLRSIVENEPSKASKQPAGALA
jgi:hypothetical protein